MVRRAAVIAAIGVGLAAAGAWAAGSRCDSGVSKAAAKKVACECGVIAKGQAKGDPPDANKLAACGTKFIKACSKAKNTADCVVQKGTCGKKETEADNAATTLCQGSPSGAFLDSAADF